MIYKVGIMQIGQPIRVDITRETNFWKESCRVSPVTKTKTVGSNAPHIQLVYTMLNKIFSRNTSQFNRHFSSEKAMDI